MMDSCVVRIRLKRKIHGWLCIYKSFRHHHLKGREKAYHESYEAHLLMYTDSSSYLERK